MLPLLQKNKDPRVLYTPSSDEQSYQVSLFSISGTEETAIFNSHEHLQLCPLRGLPAPAVPLRVVALYSHREAQQRKSCFI